MSGHQHYVYDATSDRLTNEQFTPATVPQGQPQPPAWGNSYGYDGAGNMLTVMGVKLQGQVMYF
jgi:hypothetical protein